MMKAMMGSCKEATIWMAQQDEHKLGLLKRLKLHLHLRFCAICRMFQEQSKMVNKASSELTGTLPLPESTRQKIENQMNNANDSGKS